MKTFLISYDLGQPENYSSYLNLSNFIKKTYTKWAKPLQSVWIIQSNKTAGQIRDEIKSVLDYNDKLLVIETVKHWGTYNISKDVTYWMKNNID